MTKTKKILIVDDEAEFLQTLEKGLKELSPEMNYATARNGREAIKILQNNGVDLVVTDLRMPQMDGFELLAHMNSNFPFVPVIVMSAYGNEQIREKIRSFGGMKFLQKPVDLKTFAASIHEVFENSSRGGFVTSISVASFLQLIELEEKTCLLEISNSDGEKRGFLYFENGIIYDAVSEGKVAEDAALEIVTWDNPEITFKDIPKKKIKKRIEAELMGILMEGMRIKDESSNMLAGGVLELEEDDLLQEDDPHDKMSDVKEERMDELRDSTGEEVPDNRDFNKAPSKDQKSSTQLLKEISEIQGVDAAIIIARDGFVLESAGALGDIDVDTIGASVAMVLHGAEKFGHELDLKGFETMTLESDDALIMCTEAGDALLSVLAPDSNSLGMIRIKLKKMLPALAEMF